MNKEIKEILEFKQDADYKRLSIDEIVTLENYIINLQDTLKDREEYCYGLETKLTNLQQKLEYYENIDPDKTIDKFRQKINKEMFDLQKKYEEAIKQSIVDHKYASKKEDESITYKSRIDKAIEYIKNNSYFKDNVVKTMIFQDYSNGILNILGGDEE